MDQVSHGAALTMAGGSRGADRDEMLDPLQRPGGQKRSLGISPLSTSTLWFHLQFFAPGCAVPALGLSPLRGS